MKKNIAIKTIKANYPNVFKAGYCDLQYIFRYEEPSHYNYGVYGWNCDIYTDFFNGVAITTGYRNLAGKRIPSDIIKKYSDIAKEITENPNNFSYYIIKAELDKNRCNFINELLAL